MFQQLLEFILRNAHADPRRNVCIGMISTADLSEESTTKMIASTPA